MQPRTITTKQSELASLRADKARLDFLDSLLGTYTGRVVCRMSQGGRGMRLHETSGEDGKDTNVRDAIDRYMMERSDTH